MGIKLFEPGMQRGVCKDNQGGILFIWDGLSVGPQVFMEKVNALDLQIEELRKDKQDLIEERGRLAASAEMIARWNDQKEAKLQEQERLLSRTQNALKALADRMVERFGEMIKHEPVATGKYLDAAYAVLTPEVRPKCEHEPIPLHVGNQIQKCAKCGDHFQAAEKRKDEIAENRRETGGNPDSLI